MTITEFKTFAKNHRAHNRPFFDESSDLFFARALGRLDVMEGIAGYSGSLVLEMPIAEATITAVQLDSEPTIQIVSLREK